MRQLLLIFLITVNLKISAQVSASDTTNEDSTFSPSPVLLNDVSTDQTISIRTFHENELRRASICYPGTVADLLDGYAGIYIQLTNQFYGNHVARMQGFESRHTQILRDGIPMYEGLSGSLNVVDMSSLGLERIEVTGGSNSFYFGGGGLSGVINLISKKPQDSLEFNLALNYSSPKGFYYSSFASKRYEYIGFSILSSFHKIMGYSYNSLEYTVVPEEEQVAVHPRLFIYPGKRSEIAIGANLFFDDLSAGDRDYIGTTDHYLSRIIHSWRNTFDFTYTFTVSPDHQLTATVARNEFFEELNEKQSYSQNLWIAEVADRFQLNKHTIHSGIDAFYASNPRGIYGNFLERRVIGIFMKDNWQLSNTLWLEPGLRGDVNFSPETEFILLPQFAVLWMPVSKLSFRFAYGTAYEFPDILELLDFDMMAVNPAFPIEKESSASFKLDATYQVNTKSNLLIELNQSLYYTQINYPFFIEYDDELMVYVTRQDDENQLTSVGTETYLHMQWPGGVIRFAYTHLIAEEHTDSADVYLSLNPQDRIKVAMTINIWKGLKVGYEANRFSHQYLENNEPVETIVIYSGLLMYEMKTIQFAFHAENMMNQKIQDFGEINLLPKSDPVFLPIWGPIEGRVLTASCSVKF